MKTIDLRSDTITQPTDEMIEAIINAHLMIIELSQITSDVRKSKWERNESYIVLEVIGRVGYS